MATINVKMTGAQSLAGIWQGFLAELAASHEPIQISNDGSPHAPYIVSRAELVENVAAHADDPTKDDLTATFSIDLVSV